MATVRVKGQDVRVGDDLWFAGAPHRITRIEPYRHPAVTRGEDWRTAYSDGPAGTGRAAWGITLEYGHGYADGYEVSERPGEPYENAPPADDCLSPFYGEGARLYERNAGEVARLGWRGFLAAQAAVTTGFPQGACPSG